MTEELYCQHCHEPMALHTYLQTDGESFKEFYCNNPKCPLFEGRLGVRNENI